MKAMLLRALDGPDALALEDVDAPTPAEGEVSIRVKAAGINFFDTLITRGKYQYKPELPFAPAGEVAGEIAALGPGVEGFHVGERVCAYVGWGGAQEIVVTQAASLVRIPDAVSDVVAAGVNITYGTAMYGLADRGRLARGETVAVLGAAGGAGLAAVEVAHQLGARVIAVASSAAKLEVCRQHGADLTVDYERGDLREELRRLTEGRGVDVVYDCVGGAHAEAALRSMAWLGRYLVVGFAAGEIPKFPLNLVLLKNCDVVGVFWGKAAVRDPARHAGHIARVLEWVSEGRLEPRIHGTFALSETREAIKILDQRKAHGKVVITLD